MVRDPFVGLSASNEWAILRAAAEVSECRTADLRGRARTHPLVHWRQVTMSAIRTSTGASFASIGRMFNRDHTTVIHACQRVEASVPARRARDKIVALACPPPELFNGVSFGDNEGPGACDRPGHGSTPTEEAPTNE